MTFFKGAAVAAIGLFVCAGAASAQSTSHDGMNHMNHAMPAASGSASTDAFTEANARMHKDMAITFSGDADVDFARGMIPHHQGAIDMAKIELKYGKDPELKKLAEEIIKAQESEIAFLKGWLAKKGK